MKIITIGRSDNCDIVIEDQMISRRHAVMRLHPSGRIEIIDYSQNGTSVNGVKIANGKIMRIKRGDSVTFAGTKPLDWKDVPDPSKPMKIALWTVAGIVAVMLLIWGFISVRNAVETRSAATETEIIEASGSTGTPNPQDSDRIEDKKGDKKSADYLNQDIPKSIKAQGEAERKKKEEKRKKEAAEKAKKQKDKNTEQPEPENTKDGRQLM